MSGKTLTTLRLLPLQVNQGHLRHSNIIIDHEEQYMYDREYAFEVFIICRACDVTYNHGTSHGEMN